MPELWGDQDPIVPPQRDAAFSPKENRIRRVGAFVFLGVLLAIFLRRLLWWFFSGFFCLECLHSFLRPLFPWFWLIGIPWNIPDTPGPEEWTFHEIVAWIPGAALTLFILFVVVALFIWAIEIAFGIKVFPDDEGGPHATVTHADSDEEEELFESEEEVAAEATYWQELHNANAKGHEVKEESQNDLSRSVSEEEKKPRARNIIRRDTHDDTEGSDGRTV